MVDKRELILELARKAEVSRAEAADAVDELAHRIVQAMRRVRAVPVDPGEATTGRPIIKHAEKGSGKRSSARSERRKGVRDDQPR